MPSGLKLACSYMRKEYGLWHGTCLWHIGAPMPSVLMVCRIPMEIGWLLPPFRSEQRREGLRPQENPNRIPTKEPVPVWDRPMAAPPLRPSLIPLTRLVLRAIPPGAIYRLCMRPGPGNRAVEAGRNGTIICGFAENCALLPAGCSMTPRAGGRRLPAPAMRPRRAELHASEIAFRQ